MNFLHPDRLMRLERLEDSFLAALQDVRAIKADLKEQIVTAPTLERLLDAKAVAALLGDNFSERWIYAQAKANKIPAIRLGKYWNFRPRSCRDGWNGKIAIDPLCDNAIKLA